MLTRALCFSLLTICMLAIAPAALAQGVLLNLPPVTNSQGQPIAGATINVFTASGQAPTLSCNTPVTVYKDAALSVPFTALVTDGFGNFPFYIAPLTSPYGYTVTGQNTNSTVCYGFTAMGGSGTFTTISTSSGPSTFGGSVTLGTNPLTAGAGTFSGGVSTSQLNNTYVVDGITYTTIDAAIAAVPSFTISGCTESSFTVTCTTTTNHNFLNNQFVKVGPIRTNQVSPVGYNGTWQVLNATNNTFQYTNRVSGLGAGSGGTVAPMARIYIPWTYTGAESVNCAVITGGVTQSMEPQNIIIEDARGGNLCGYNVAWNSGQEGATTLLSAWQYVQNPTSTSSVMLGTNQVSGSIANNGTMAAITGELDVVGTITPLGGTITTLEGFTKIQAVGSNLPLVYGTTSSVNLQDAGVGSAGIITGAAYSAAPCTNSSSHSTITNCYGFTTAGGNTTGTARNYGAFLQNGSGSTNFGAILLDFNGGSFIDLEDSGGVIRRWLYEDSTNNVHMQMNNTGFISLDANDGSSRVALNASKIGLEAGFPLVWTSGAPLSTSADTGLSRDAAGVVDVGTGAQGSTAGTLKLGALVSAGIAAGLSGTGACATITSQVGGESAGSAKCTGVTGASTVTITPGFTAPNGWNCTVQDETTRANVFQQTSHSPTACVLTATSVTSGDVFTFSALAF